jgi:hypothetical protein
VWAVLAFLSALGLAGCAGENIPPADQFKSSPIGTPLPQGAELKPLQVPQDSGAVLFLNQAGSPIRVAVNGAITDIRVQESFLFVLPPGTQRFYIYEIDAKPKVYIQQVEKGKIRYVYYLRTSPAG